jgi:hypothetical protein
VYWRVAFFMDGEKERILCKSIDFTKIV